MMKKIYLLITLLYVPLALWSQHEEKSLLTTPNGWTKEVLGIPFGFAPQINYQGFEDIRFAKGWSNVESIEFWTYAFVWNINLYEKPDATFFTTNLQLYFDGLMTAVNKNNNVTVPKTKVLIQQKEEADERTFFSGSVTLYDAFKTQKQLTLQLVIESKYCSKTKTYLPVFRFSPQPFEHPVWKELYVVKLKENNCQPTQ